MSKVFAIEVTETYSKTYHVKAETYEDAQAALSDAFCSASVLSPAFNDGWNQDDYVLVDVYDHLNEAYIDVDNTEGNADE